MLRRFEVCGLALSLGGVLVIVGHGELARLAVLSFNPGDLWIMVSVLMWAVYTQLLVRRPAGLEPMLLLALLTAIGIAGLLPAYLWELAHWLRIQASAATLASVVYTGVFPAFLGYILWNRAVTRVGPARAGLLIHLMPAATPLPSVLFLGEGPRP